MNTDNFVLSLAIYLMYLAYLLYNFPVRNKVYIEVGM